MLFLEPMAARAHQRRPELLRDDCVAHERSAFDLTQKQIRWSPPTYSNKWDESPPFCSRFLSSSPPLTRSKQNFKSGYLDGGNNASSTFIHRKRPEELKLFAKSMEHSSGNDDGSRPTNSLQLYNADYERGNLQNVNSPHEARCELGIRQSGNSGVPIMAPVHSQFQPSYANLHPVNAMGHGLTGTKMLIDPATGQQYYVPTAQPQLAYYPVFYNAAPSPQTQPIFYQPAPTGYFLPHAQPMPASPTHHCTGSQPMFFQQHQDTSKVDNYANLPQQSAAVSCASNTYAHNQAYGSPPYHVEIPPSNASVASNFQRNHESRISTESGASSASSSSRNKHSDDSMSPITPLKDGTVDYGGGQGVRHTQQNFNSTKLFPDNWLHNSARYSSATSSSSGFYSADASATDRLHLSARLSGASETAHTSPTHRKSEQQSRDDAQLQKHQRWWHNDPSQYPQTPRKENEKTQFNESDKPNDGFNPARLTAQNRDCSSSPKSQDDVFSPYKPTQKAIRMDIDLSQPLPTKQATLIEKAAVKANITPPTAFTISFDDAEQVGQNLKLIAKSPKKMPISLQDAARQAPTGRRLMQRSVPKNATSDIISNNYDGQGGATMVGQDPKEYLFSKMFENCAKRGDDIANNDALASSQLLSFDDKRDVDTLSEAGTYIVEKENTMVTSQVLDSEEDSDASSSTSTTISHNESSEGGHHLIQATQHVLHKPTAVRADASLYGNAQRNFAEVTPVKSQDSSINSFTTPKMSPPPPVRRSLMSDLRKLREEKNSSSNISAPITSPRRLLSAKSTAPVRPAYLPVIGTAQKSTASAFSTRLCQNQSQISSAGNTNTRTFRRADGGRFSMRSSTGFSASGYTGGTGGKAQNFGKPPFRTGTGNIPKSTNKQPQETPEMLAWLRRKEYDPRKAAAEARKMQQLKLSLLKLTSFCENGFETGAETLQTDKTSAQWSSKKLLEEHYLANRSVSYHNAGGFSSGANSAFQQWRKPLGDDRSNKSYDNLSHLGEENVDDFSQLCIADNSNNLKKTVDALTQKCHKSIELIKLCNKNALSPSVENLLQSVVESTNPLDVESTSSYEESNKISDRLERLSSAFDAIQKYLEEQSSSSPASSTKILGLMPRTSTSRPAGSSTQRLLLDISELRKAHDASPKFNEPAQSDGDLPPENKL